MMALVEDKFYYVFDVEVILAKTEKAILVQIDGTKFWLPKSQMLGWNDGLNKHIALPYWMADQNNLLATNWNGSHVHNFTAFTGKQLRDYLNNHGLAI